MKQGNPPVSLSNASVAMGTSSKSINSSISKTNVKNGGSPKKEMKSLLNKLRSSQKSIDTRNNEYSGSSSSGSSSSSSSSSGSTSN